MKKIVLLLCLLIGFTGANAQSGEIRGKVTDTSGAIVSFAAVAIVDSSGRSTGGGTTTDLDGNYSIKDLKPGIYNLRYFLAGYKEQTEHGLVVSADKATLVNVRLKYTTPWNMPPNGGWRPPIQVH